VSPEASAVSTRRRLFPLVTSLEGPLFFSFRVVDLNFGHEMIISCSSHPTGALYPTSGFVCLLLSPLLSASPRDPCNAEHDFAAGGRAEP